MGGRDGPWRLLTQEEELEETWEEAEAREATAAREKCAEREEGSVSPVSDDIRS